MVPEEGICLKHETVYLLNQCHLGAKMAVESIDLVLGHVHSRELRDHLQDSRKLHADLEQASAELLRKMGQSGKNPGLIAEKMAQIKTEVQLRLRPGDGTVAALMTDGCHTGTKTLARQLNRHMTADIQSREIARRMIGVEDQMATGLRAYL